LILGLKKVTKVGVILIYFHILKNMKKRYGVHDETYRGSKGELPITDLEYRDPLCEAFIKGAIGYGIPLNKRL